MSLGSDFFLSLFLKFWLEVFLNAAFRKYERGHTVLWKVQRRQMPSKTLGTKGARPLQQFSAVWPWMTERPPEAGPESGSFYTTSIGKCPDPGFSPLFRRLSGFWCVCWAGWAELINEVWTPEASLICVPYTLRGASNVSESITQLSRQFSNVEKWANFWCANINTSQKHNFHVVAFTNCHWCERLFTIG